MSRKLKTLIVDDERDAVDFRGFRETGISSGRTIPSSSTSSL
ncbi:MAG: hypothetical protein WAW07_05805 [Bacteroidales bacterium]